MSVHVLLLSVLVIYLTIITNQGGGWGVDLTKPGEIVPSGRCCPVVSCPIVSIAQRVVAMFLPLAAPATGQSDLKDLSKSYKEREGCSLVTRLLSDLWENRV